MSYWKSVGFLFSSISIIASSRFAMRCAKASPTHDSEPRADPVIAKILKIYTARFREVLDDLICRYRAIAKPIARALTCRGFTVLRIKPKFLLRSKRRMICLWSFHAIKIAAGIFLTSYLVTLACSLRLNSEVIPFVFGTILLP